jgi:ankyrin repeat protein
MRKVTPLLNASQHGRLEAARLLLEHGADMNHWDEGAWSPLERASEGGHYDIAWLLLDHDMNANE